MTRVAMWSRLAALCALASGGCTFGERSVPAGEDKPVIHAVLNAATEEEFVLVERTLTGRVAVRDDSLSTAGDPIVGGGGVPISGARVTVTGPDGAVATLIETQTSAPGASTTRGTGVYFFQNLTPLGQTASTKPAAGLGPANALRIVPGGRYKLRVEVPDGRVATGQALVPGNASTSFRDEITTLTFLRDKDTLHLRWDPVPGARTYALRVGTPYGAFFLFSDSTSYDLTGDLHNLFADRLPHVLQPGFTQNVFVAAVDTNYFDYYRSTNSPFTGSGIINRLDGAIGFFGAYVPITSRTLFVRQNDVDPIDGRYFAAAPNGQDLLRLWVDSKGSGSDPAIQLSGAYRLPGDVQYGVLGTLQSGKIHLRALDDDAKLIVRQLDGTMSGDTIRVKVTGQIPTNDPGDRVFIKQAPTP